MKTILDQNTIKQINNRLLNGETLEQIAKDMGYNSLSSFYNQVTRGYKLQKQFVPIHSQLAT